MKKFLLLAALVISSLALRAQTDSTCAVIMKLYNTLDSKDKVERNKYKNATGEVRQGPLGKVTIYKSTLSIPGFTAPEFSEGGGTARAFQAEVNVSSYEDAVKKWDELDKKLHSCFAGGWTFTENNEPRDLYKNSKVVKDGSLLSPVVRYYLERTASGFRLIMAITY